MAMANLKAQKFLKAKKKAKAGPANPTPTSREKTQWYFQ